MFLFAVIPFYLFCSISKMSTFFCWQIAASYGSILCVFEPVQQPDQKDASLTVSSLHFLPVTV